METKGIFKFKIIINVLVSSLRLISVPMLRDYGHYKYVYPYSAGIDFWRQILTTKVDPRTVRVKWFTVLSAKHFFYLRGIADQITVIQNEMSV